MLARRCELLVRKAAAGLRWRLSDIKASLSTQAPAPDGTSTQPETSAPAERDVGDRRAAKRIAIKIAAENTPLLDRWGDYHFALALKRSFESLGCAARVDCLDQWDNTAHIDDDCVLVLRGLERYTPRPGPTHVMWNISHPRSVSLEEYAEYDHVFVASTYWADMLTSRGLSTVAPLLQCTDPDLFHPDPDPAAPSHELLFVGNSRRRLRETVRYAYEAGLPLAVYGSAWKTLLPRTVLRDDYIDNARLRTFYSRAQVVLNDHWPSMREMGFISNRIFDAGACGACVLSDRVRGMDAVFQDALCTYEGRDDFATQARRLLAHPEERLEMGQRLAAAVRDAHTFAHRAQTIVETLW